MTSLSPRMDAALDEAVERMSATLLKWGENSKGPSNGWTLGIAEVIDTLVRTRIRLSEASNQDTKVSLLESLVEINERRLARMPALEAVARAARSFADDEMCLDPDCIHKVCVLNRALADLDSNTDRGQA